MRFEFYVVLSKSPAHPIRIVADSFVVFMDELNSIVQKYGPFDLIYRG